MNHTAGSPPAVDAEAGFWKEARAQRVSAMGITRRPCGTISTVPTIRITQDDAADDLLSRDPLALVLGMLFDQHMRQRSSANSTLTESGSDVPTR